MFNGIPFFFFFPLANWVKEASKMLENKGCYHIIIHGKGPSPKAKVRIF